LGTPAFVVLLIAGTWSIAFDSKAEWWETALIIVVLWVVFLGLLIVPGIWWFNRLWHRIPALQVDAWGVVWGDDWSRDIAIEWRNIAAITSKRFSSGGYSDRLLLLHPRDHPNSATLSAANRLVAWGNRKMFGGTFVIQLGTLRIKSEELVALIRQRYSGPMDLSAIQES